MRSALVCAAAVLLFAAGCTGETRSASTGSAGSTKTDAAPSTKVYDGKYPIHVITTCGMVTDIVEHVGGDKVTVTGLMGQGVDPHLYKPTRNDVKQLNDADVVFFSGLMLEGRMGDTFTKVARGGKPVFAVTEGIDEKYLREPPEFQGHWDPHVWMDVSAWSECTGFVAEALGKYDPANKDYYRENAEAYRAQLKELDDYVRKVIASIPEEQRVLVTAHDAFGYFSRAYKIPVASAQGVSTESEAGVSDINKLVDMVVDKKVQAIFVESSVNPKNIQAVIEGAAAKGHRVKVGGELFSDAMGAAGTYEGTYIGMLDHNATTMALALGGTAPETGLHGKLKPTSPAKP